MRGLKSRVVDQHAAEFNIGSFPCDGDGYGSSDFGIVSFRALCNTGLKYVHGAMDQSGLRPSVFVCISSGERTWRVSCYGFP